MVGVVTLDEACGAGDASPVLFGGSSSSSGTIKNHTMNPVNIKNTKLVIIINVFLSSIYIYFLLLLYMESIGFVATCISIFRTCPELYNVYTNNKDVSTYSMRYILLGIVTSLMWLVYSTYRNDRSMFYLLPLLLGLTMETMILFKILQSHEPSESSYPGVLDWTQNLL